MSDISYRPERFLFSYNDGDRHFAVAVRAISFAEAKTAFQHMSRDERRRNIVSTMAADDIDLIDMMALWVKRTFFGARRST